MALASLGLPGLSGFVGEFLSLAGVFMVFKPIGVIAAVGLVALVALFLVIIKKVLWGKPAGTVCWPDMTAREMALIVPLVVLTLVIGFYPDSILKFQQKTVDSITQNHDHRMKAVWAGAPGHNTIYWHN
jgi:NADH-quinone oxidoreductase subunit M